MNQGDLQVIIIPKTVAKRRPSAYSIAKKYSNKIYTSRETGKSWRFRVRPPKDFLPYSFRTFKIPDSGISLVYGTLKDNLSKKNHGRTIKNPDSKQLKLFDQVGDKISQIELSKKDLNTTPPEQINLLQPTEEIRKVPVRSTARKTKKVSQLKLPERIINRPAASQLPFFPSLSIYDLDKRYYENYFREKIREKLSLDELKDIIRDYLNKYSGYRPEYVAAVAFSTELDKVVRDLILKFEFSRFKLPESDIYRKIKYHNQITTEEYLDFLRKLLMVENPSKNIMPNPGPCAWLGSLLEWSWSDGGKQRVWIPDDLKWMFLWSPDHKAVVCIRKRPMVKLSKVSRKAGAAKMFERFSARNAKQTFSLNDFPAPNLKLLGPAIHIIYRSDKWGNQNQDYIHDFKKGVKLYVGPNLKNPEVFFCLGGKLTLTERGLVF